MPVVIAPRDKPQAASHACHSGECRTGGNGRLFVILRSVLGTAGAMSERSKPSPVVEIPPYTPGSIGGPGKSSAFP